MKGIFHNLQINHKLISLQKVNISQRATTDSKSLSRNRKDSRPISQQEVTRYIVIDGNNVAIK